MQPGFGFVRSFLESEGYVSTQLQAGDVTMLMQQVVADKGWSANPKTQLCHMYLI